MTEFKFKLTTQVGLEKLVCDATTFAQLREQIKNSPIGDKISFDRVKEIREGKEWVKTIKLVEKNTLAEFGEIDDARLPSGESIIFFVIPIEHKGGITLDEVFDEDNEDVTIENLEELGYNDLMQIGSQLNKKYQADINLKGRRDDVLGCIIGWIEDYFENKEYHGIEENSLEFESIKANLYEAINIIEDVISKLQEASLDDSLITLHARALNLQSQLNR